MRGQIVTDVTVAATPTSLSGMSYFTASRCITPTSNRHASPWDFLPPESFSSETAFHQRRYTRSRRADALRLCAPSASISVRLSSQHHMRTARCQVSSGVTENHLERPEQGRLTCTACRGRGTSKHGLWAGWPLAGRQSLQVGRRHRPSLKFPILLQSS